MVSTCSWLRTLWERMWYYSFILHLDLEPILPPREGDAVVLYLFLDQPGDAHISLNCCRISHRMLWQSDIVTTNVRQIDEEYLFSASDDVEPDSSWFTFDREQPTARDWLEWTVF